MCTTNSNLAVFMKDTMGCRRKANEASLPPCMLLMLHAYSYDVPHPFNYAAHTSQVKRRMLVVLLS